MRYDLLIRGGTYFDGTGAPGVRADVGVRDGHVAEVGDLSAHEAPEVVDAEGAWVMPGFLDMHTHYDAELFTTPALEESVRHGVTTVCIGSCSLSTILSDAEDCADMFARVEALPREHVLSTLQTHKTWTTPAAYADAVDALPLGPNVAAYLGHSDMRVAAMGLGPATDADVFPTDAQLEQMEAALNAAIDAGFLGMSSMTNPWDKVGGDRFRSRRLPSTYATWGEYRRLHRLLRARGAILQSAPNITTKVNAILFLAASAGAFVRKPLKTTLITAADAKSSPGLSWAITNATRLWNLFFRSNLRWQTVPMPFEVYADGIDLVVFEEFGAGEEALHLTDQVSRNALFKDPAYRRRFRKDYGKKVGPRVWQRDFHDATVVDAPDAALIGRSFGAIADDWDDHPVDMFLDLVIEHGAELRWKTTIANHRPKVLDALAKHPCVQLGFADSGAHVRNMAFYNFPLYFLRSVQRAAARGKPMMSIERAVHRVSGEQAQWFDLDAGRIQVGDRADIVVVDPAGLDDSLDGYHEAPMEGFGGLLRMVRRNDGAVRATVIGGRLAYTPGRFAEGLGTTQGYGRFLRAHQKVPARPAP